MIDGESLKGLFLADGQLNLIASDPMEKILYLGFP